ncbi:MAG: hypothetical protein IPK03_06195 [Bacteroidetes bacterium]|nr:hypothetical protein [Bacteroidota bacterium]
MYQVLETKSPEVKLENNAYIFENPDLLINYDFWAMGGQVSFSITNKLDIPIYIDWDHSHLINNGISYEYWYDEEVSRTTYRSSTSSAGVSALSVIAAAYGYPQSNYRYSATSGSMASQSKKTKQIIQLPPKSTIQVSKFAISRSVYFDCDFNLSHKSLKQSDSKTFGLEVSPVTFRNFLSYSTSEKSEADKLIDNKFYISMATFASKIKFAGKMSAKANACNISGRKSRYAFEKISPYKKPNAFFLRAR